MSNLGLLNAESRSDTSTQANNRLRKAGSVPGNIYGKGMESVAVSVRKDELRRAIAKHGRSAVFELNLDGKTKFTVMVKDIQFTHLIKDLMHVDFHSISLTEETRANVPVRVVGDEMFEARRLLIQIQRDILPVRGLPQDVPNFIEIDVAGLDDGDTVFISDIAFPEGIYSDLEDAQVVLSVSEAKVHQEEEDEDDVEGEEDVEVADTDEPAEENEEA